jgi:hypothetical protein
MRSEECFIDLGFWEREVGFFLFLVQYDQLL